MSLENIKCNYVNVSLAAGGVHRVVNLAQVLFAEMVGATSHLYMNEGAPAVLIIVGDFRDVVAGAGAAGMDNGPLFGEFTNVDGGGVFVSRVVVNFDRLTYITGPNGYNFAGYGSFAYTFLESIADVLGGMGHSLQDVGIFSVNQTGNFLAPPVQAAAATAAVGGTVPDDTYFLEITSLDSAGETIGSNEVSIVTAGGDLSTITANWALDADATGGYNAYIGVGAGAETRYYHAAAGATSLTITSLTAGTVGTVPTTNTAALSNTQQHINVKNVTHQVPSGTNWDTFFVDATHVLYVENVMDLVGG